MSDMRLRGLERRFLETGSIKDEASFLQEQVRIGVVEYQRLQIASYFGHPASELVVGKLAPEGKDFYSAELLKEFPREVIHRMAVSLASQLQQIFPPNRQFQFVFYGLLHSCARYIFDPSDRLWARISTLGSQVDSMVLLQDEDEQSQILPLMRLFMILCDIFWHPDTNLVRRSLARLGKRSSSIIGQEQLAQAVRTDLLAWVFGDPDPVISLVACLELELERVA